MNTNLILGASLSALLLACPASAGIVINEIFYHAPDDVEDLQWIELHNPDREPVDVSGWRLTRGVEFRFSEASVLPAGGFVVLCKDATLFAEFYEAKVDGEFTKSLGRGGDTVELVDASGKLVDRVDYDDRNPWPSSADGTSASLERITPGASGQLADNWSASPLPEDMKRPAGTPGRVNASYSVNFPPSISGLTVSPRDPAPGQPIGVRAIIEHHDGLETVELRYRVARSGVVGKEEVVPMTTTGGKNFSGELPGFDASQLVRIRVRATDRQQAERFQPSPNALAPAVSVFVQARPTAANIPLVQMIHTDPRELAEMNRVRQRALRPNAGPLNDGGPRELLGWLDQQLDLPAAWFEWSVNRPVDAAAYRTLRKVMAVRNSERNALKEEALAADDLATFKAPATARIKVLQDSLLADAKSALPVETGAAFERWYHEQLRPGEPDPMGFLKGLFNLEARWLALNTEFELTAGQVHELRPALQTAARGRAELLPLLQKVMAGEGDFLGLLTNLGKVETQLDAQLKRQLTLRQRRFLQQWKGSQGSFIRPRMVEARPRPPRGSAAFIHTNPMTGETEVFDFIHITERSAGYKARFHKDRPLRGMSAVNVIFEYNDRFVLAEPLAFELYRRVGNAAPQTDFVRLTLNGQPMGYHLLFEQVNGSFLRRNQLNPDGDLYKLIWYGLGIEGQHEKQDHPDRSHADLVKLIGQIDTTPHAAQWKLIQQHFNVDQVVNYFAVNMVLSHWDGYFNNYFIYHDRRGSGKWEIYPWDQDKTWGVHDQSGDQVFFDLPLTFGMAGDRPPGDGPAFMNPGHWWRPGGYFSKPLLANPEFRQQFLQRIRQILEETYNEEVFFPIIDALAARLRPEIPIRAQAIGEEASQALARLDRNVASLKEHLMKRRQFLLAQEELVKLTR